MNPCTSIVTTRGTDRGEQYPCVHFTYALFRCELKSYKSLSSS